MAHFFKHSILEDACKRARVVLHCKSEDLRKYFAQVYGTLQIALVLFFGNINKKA
jgi:hypothetical protein